MAKTHTLPDSRKIITVPREQLRFKLHGRCFGIPDHLRALLAVALPTPPAVFSGSKNRAIKYPTLGNDVEGDCYLVDALHCIQTFTGNSVGTPAQFATADALKRYEQLSGGDNGLGDDQIFPAWKTGLLPVNGPHKILDEMTVDPRDDAAIRLGMWLFCGASWTAALPDAWINGASPGATWDSGTPDPANGHAMHLSGYGADYECETWGFNPAIKLTPAGLKSADPEVTLQFSLEMFNAQGIAPHNNMTYDQLAPLWKQLGGITLPPSPFGPTPTPVPVPPPGPTPIPTPPPVPVDYKGWMDRQFAVAEKQYAHRPLALSQLRSAQAILDHQVAGASVGLGWQVVLAAALAMARAAGPYAVPAIDAYLDTLHLPPAVRAMIDAALAACLAGNQTPAA